MVTDTQHCQSFRFFSLHFFYVVLYAAITHHTKRERDSEHSFMGLWSIVSLLCLSRTFTRFCVRVDYFFWPLRTTSTLELTNRVSQFKQQMSSCQMIPIRSLFLPYHMWLDATWEFSTPVRKVRGRNRKNSFHDVKHCGRNGIYFMTETASLSCSCTIKNAPSHSQDTDEQQKNALQFCAAWQFDFIPLSPAIYRFKWCNSIVSKSTHSAKQWAACLFV